MSELKDQIKKEVSEAITTEIKNVKNWNQQYPCYKSMRRTFRSKWVYIKM